MTIDRRLGSRPVAVEARGGHRLFEFADRRQILVDFALVGGAKASSNKASSNKASKPKASKAKSSKPKSKSRSKSRSNRG